MFIGEAALLSYATLGSDRLPAAISFYDQLFADFGITKLFDHPSGGRVYGIDGKIVFGLVGPYDGGMATVGNASMVAFRFDDTATVSAFYAKALSLGATNAGPPGFRGDSPFFMSYFRDLDGHKVCGFHQARPI